MKVGYPALNAKKYIPQLTRQFYNKYPEIKVTFIENNCTLLSKALWQDEIDIALILSPALYNLELLRIKTLFPEKYCLLLNNKHPLAGKPIVEIKELVQEQFVLTKREADPELNDMILALCRKNGFLPQIVFQPYDFDTLFLLVGAGVGISITYSLIARNFRSNKVAINRIKGEDPGFDFVAAWKKTNDNPVIFLFLNEIEKIIAEDNKIFMVNNN